MAKTKTKMISVRVSEDDYQLLKDKYESHGTRSVSALAREALHAVIGRSGPKLGDLETEVVILHGKVTALQREVSRLARIVSDGLLVNKAVD
jgi:hypothetical protein